METWLPAVSVHRYLSPLDWFRHDSAWGQGLPQDVTVNKTKMSRQCGHQVGIDFWKQRLALTAKIMYHCQYSRDTRTRGSGGGGQGKEDDSSSPECETSPKLRAFSYILEDHFAWGWYGVQFAELFEIQHDGRGEAAENGADRDYEEDEEDDADYDQEQSDRMALEPSGVVTSIPPFASPATTPPLSSPSSSTGGLVHCM
ncbi:hypothetical protein EV421DRAFT_2042590 [Armillaria borealis]|uniref:Uncharacterized protein n=1 Tax=Armillaria borealis TaxID=47425 RepID=A0AA39MDF8_9AGAR|nr:hypothetical protein EV421DRAFT_2042590 [Armillaria borealis]